jgi:hypothetical protein
VARNSGSDSGDAEDVEPEDVGAEDVEPADIGGTDWLLQQLGGGREISRADAPRDAAEKGDDERDGESAGETDLPATGSGAGVPPVEPDAALPADAPTTDAPSAPPATPPATPPTSASPKLRWSWESGTVEPIEQPDPISQPAADTAPDASSERVAHDRTDLPAALGNPERPPTQPATFNWALTPTDDVDPLVAQTTSPPRSSAPATPPARSANESEDAENVYFHPALPIPGAEPEASAETTEIPVADAETTPPPVAPADTTPVDAAEPQDETPTVVIPADPTVPLAAALERQRAAAESERRAAAETGAVPVAAAAATRTGARRGTAAAASSSGNSGGPNKRTTRILFWVAGGLLVVLVLIGLYVFGRQIPGFVSAAPTPTPTATTTPTPTPTPTPTAQATGPQAPGVHAWDTLRGGECLNPFSSPWALKFTVVDCATPHAAQLVYTNVFSSDPAAAFPGDAQLASQINLLCTKPGIINLDAAGAFTDAQIQGSYPATEKQWKSGQRSYFCFVNRAGGEPLTGSIAGPGPAA